MMSKLPRVLWVLMIAVAGVAVWGGTALATPSSGFAGVTEAKATYGEIFSQVQTRDPQFWTEVIKTVGAISRDGPSRDRLGGLACAAAANERSNRW